MSSINPEILPCPSTSSGNVTVQILYPYNIYVHYLIIGLNPIRVFMYLY
jgi:hypothetical protein